jgi:hypothetical protein
MWPGHIQTNRPASLITLQKNNTMIIAKVTYTVKSDFVQENQQNINLFMADFKQMKDIQFRYNVYLLEDGITFLHLAHFQNADVQKQILAVPSFKLFQKKRDESGIDNSHKVEMITLIDASSDLLA